MIFFEFTDEICTFEESGETGKVVFVFYSRDVLPILKNPNSDTDEREKYKKFSILFEDFEAARKFFVANAVCIENICAAMMPPDGVRMH